MLHTFTNILVKKLVRNDLVGRLVKYLIKCPYYTSSAHRRSNKYYFTFTILVIMCRFRSDRKSTPKETRL